MKILFIHGLASSGAYKTADTLRILLRPCEVIAPDVPPEPYSAQDMLRRICDEEHPDVIVGLSLGGFWAQMLRGYRRFLINPEFHPYRLMRTMKGECRYLSPRRDGATSFMITEEMCKGYEAIASSQFDGISQDDVTLVTGLFADHDELVHCKPEFDSWYPGRSVSYPGEHLPTYPQIKTWLVPLMDRPNG